MFSLGFYTYQTDIGRSTQSTGSADSPFGCYPISLGRRSLHNFFIPSPGFLPRKRTFQRSTWAVAPRLICKFYTTAYFYLLFYYKVVIFSYNSVFQVSKATPCQSESFLDFITVGEAFSSICVCFRIWHIVSITSSDHIHFWIWAILSIALHFETTHPETVEMKSSPRPWRCCASSLSYWWLPCWVSARQLMHFSLLGKHICQLFMHAHGFASSRLMALSTHARVLVSSINSGL